MRKVKGKPNALLKPIIYQFSINFYFFFIFNEKPCVYNTFRNKKTLISRMRE